MSVRTLKLLLIDQDPIFRLGLKVALEADPNLQVIESAETHTTALQILAELTKNDPWQIDIIILELCNGSNQQLGLQFCHQFKSQYPNLPILLLSSFSEPAVVLAAKKAGINGYVPKGTPVSELVAVVQEVAAGGSYWFGEQGSREVEMNNNTLPGASYSVPLTPLKRLRQNLRLSGIGYVDASLAEVTAKLQVPAMPLVEQIILAGKRRELLAARWLVNKFWGIPQQTQQDNQTYIPSLLDNGKENYVISGEITQSDFSKVSNSVSQLSPRSLQAELFASCVQKLQLTLQNVTDISLEIDILREDKKRQLLYLILQKFANILDDLRVSQIDISQLKKFNRTLLLDLWQGVTTDFFGKFTQISIDNRTVEIVNFLLQESQVVQTEMLNRVPLFIELLSYLLFQTDLNIDNTLYQADSTEAKEQGLMLLENLLIQIANSVLQPLLNRLADVEIIKQDYYDTKLISTREIEKFRNSLSWKYRLRDSITEAQAIFESRYELFILAPRGIAKISIYAPRAEELAQLSGIPLAVTLILEFRDAIAPRLRSLLSLFGSGVVFILTQIVGRGLGLVGRGILQGIGSTSLRDINFKRNNERK
jgi:DNA-binding NarL/FixJ family response regulator